jgi:hypothetical protein
LILSKSLLLKSSSIVSFLSYLITIFFKSDKSDISFNEEVTGGFNNNIDENSFKPGSFTIIYSSLLFFINISSIILFEGKFIY